LFENSGGQFGGQTYLSHLIFLYKWWAEAGKDMGKLSAKQMRALSKNEAKKHPDGAGLYFCVRKSGTSYWMLRYTANSKRREITLGHYPEMTLADARAEATIQKREVKLGIDPLAEKKRPERASIRTINDLAADWLKNDIEKRVKHPEIQRRVYRKDLAPVFGELSMDRITPLDIRHAIEQISDSGRPTTANDALGHCKQLFRHAIRLDLMKSNPAEAFTVHQAGGVEQSRIRALTIDELKTVFSVFRENKSQFTRENYLAAALLLTLGVRKGELIAATWDELDINARLWDLPKERNKTGVDISIPLPSITVGWLEELHMRACGSEYIFPSRRASKRRDYISDDTLNHALGNLFGLKVRPGVPPENKLGNAGVDHFTIHDLRRTCRSLLAGAGVPAHIAERCLNHKIKGVEGIYDRYDYLEERREALQKIADQLAPIINPISKITGFRKEV
jgi:integrase